MGSTDAKIPRFRITYYDSDRTEDVVVVGAWELTLAERKFFPGAVSQGSMDAITYAAFCGAKRAGLVADGVQYDAWAKDVAAVDSVESGESQPPLDH